MTRHTSQRSKLYSIHRFAVYYTVWIFIASAYIRPVHAHPAHAKPVNYPFVVGFERFFTDLDTADHLARGGLVLLNELNCVACHKPPPHLAEQLTGRVGTRLTGVADRFDDLDLEMMIRNPRFVKTDTIMPSMFSGPDRDLDELDALKHFLSTLSDPPPKYAAGDLDNGRILYHKIGCVSCHAPELDYRPPWVPENVELYTALPSVPMNLADRYPRDVLIDLILDPYKHRPSGRMPKFDLTRQEAIDIGTYLNSTPKPELPQNLQQALTKAEPFAIDDDLVKKGRHLFASKNCVACHPDIVAAAPILSKSLVELSPLIPNPDKPSAPVPSGCLSARPVGGGAPAYGLDQIQKRAISEALKSIRETTIDTPERQVDWALSTRNCYACHQRNSKGGPESAREAFFGVENIESLANGTWATHPPTLDGAGTKLTNAWWDRALYHRGGSGSVRHHYMSARMPIYRLQDVSGLPTLLREIDQSPQSSQLPKGDPDNGCKLVSRSSKHCVACHGLGDLPPPDATSIPLDQTTQRLSSDYFLRLLRDPQSIDPALPMPNADLTDQQIADIWAYLGEIDQHPLPEGLLLPDVTELVPDEQPLVIRSGLAEIADDALVIGFPSGNHAAFNISTCRWVATWQGRFIDPGSDWDGTEPTPITLLEKHTKPTHLISLPKPKSTYLGFQIETNGTVSIHYTADQQPLVETLSSDLMRVVKTTTGEQISRENLVP